MIRRRKIRKQFFVALSVVAIAVSTIADEPGSSQRKTQNLLTVEYTEQAVERSFIEFSHEAMATQFRIIFYSESENVLRDDYERLAREAFDLIDDVESRFSRYKSDSEITALNNRAAISPVKVSADVVDLLTNVKEIYVGTNGAFDPTVGPLLNVWGFYRKTGVLPERSAVEDALQKVGFDKVHIDFAERTVFYEKPDMMLDLGGVAKGYALDKAAELLKQYGIKTAALDAGTSSVVLMGAPKGQEGWLVRLRHPYKTDEFIVEVSLRDTTFSASGLGERYVEIDGKRYGHIFDPHTGYPVEGFASTVAIAPRATVSDALSTAFFVMGEENVRQYIRRFPEIRAILVPVSDTGETRAITIDMRQNESEGQS